LENARASMTQGKAPEPTTGNAQPATSPQKSPFTFFVEDISLKDVAADYRQAATGQLIRFNVGALLLAIEKMDLARQEIAVDRFSLADTFVAYHQAATPTGQDHPSQSNRQRTAKPWHVTLATLEMANNNLQYYDFREPFVKKGIDFHHLWV